MYPLNSEFFVSEDWERRGRKSSTFQFYSSRLMRKIDCYIETWLKSSNFVKFRQLQEVRYTKDDEKSTDLG